ncbi:hypothetical protein I7X43_09510 [Inhella sp. 4Y17]|uniref:FimV N-terminal domain-containing protein n=2 Tax=Inhella gelatinilytica TaxID=2795030 RepID=A0A931J027_9BURK|nr:hypothetical protein [Inhella gelatinilytica]
MCALSTSAYALGMGRLSVQSALGETLKAEIELTSLSAEEASSLQVKVAPPDVYRSSGLEYNSVLTGAQVQLSRRADGRPVLRITSDRAVQEPFLDVVLDVRWSSGRLTREFTLLLDPPSHAKPAEPQTPPVVSAPAPVVPPKPVTESREPKSSRGDKPNASVPVALAPTTEGGLTTVRAGDSLSRMAGRHGMPGVSLDQMLVALYRQNPDAFMGDNMNLLRAGAKLKLPSREAALAVDKAEARKLIQAHSSNFEAARQGLASAAPKLPKAPERAAKGGVEAVVTEPKATPSGDRLTLSKPVVAPQPAAPKTATPEPTPASQAAALTRNVEDLKKVAEEAKAQASAPASAPVAAAPASVPASAAPAVPVASAPASKPMAPPPVQDEKPSSFWDLLFTPLGAAGALGVLGLLGFGAYRLTRKNKGFEPRETLFGESRLQPDSFFGVTGGQKVDTRDGGNSVSSMSYSLSQLDAHGDVDPVAEADVYLAYGRDLQAEEILKEALRAQPDRLAVRLKLLEVYAKRRDVRGFEKLATEFHAATGGKGEDWDKAREMGLSIDPTNPLYQQGGSPRKLFEDEGSTGPSATPDTVPLGPTPQPEPVADRVVETDAGPVSLMDLDLDLDGPASAADSGLDKTQGNPAQPAALPELGMDLDLDIGGPAAPPAPAPTASDGGLSFDLGNLDLGSASPAEPDTVSPHDDGTASRVGGDSLIDAMQDLADDDGDPLQRQFELAEEFRQIGDTEGARDVLQELIRQVGSGPLYEKAKALLDSLR